MMKLTFDTTHKIWRWKKITSLHKPCLHFRIWDPISGNDTIFDSQNRIPKSDPNGRKSKPGFTRSYCKWGLCCWCFCCSRTRSGWLAGCNWSTSRGGCSWTWRLCPVRPDSSGPAAPRPIGSSSKERTTDCSKRFDRRKLKIFQVFFLVFHHKLWSLNL